MNLSSPSSAALTSSSQVKPLSSISFSISYGYASYGSSASQGAISLDPSMFPITVSFSASSSS